MKILRRGFGSFLPGGETGLIQAQLGWHDGSSGCCVGEARGAQQQYPSTSSTQRADRCPDGAQYN
jgi:hypothetical protein